VRSSDKTDPVVLLILIFFKIPQFDGSLLFENKKKMKPMVINKIKYPPNNAQNPPGNKENLNFFFS
jgi:hypothetical protein